MFSDPVAVLRTILSFGVVIGVLVFIHELGHYLAARWMGVHVEAFSIGFGRPLKSWTDRRGTVWKLSWIPLGGYVKLHGQERPEDVSADVRALWQPGRTFHEKQVWRRSIVVAAGPIANFLLATLIFAAVFVAEGRAISEPVVGEVAADTAAARAGLQPGDRIEAIDGQPIPTFEALQNVIVMHPGDRLTMEVRRGANAMTIVATPDSTTRGSRKEGRLGISSRALRYEPVSVIDAIPAGAEQTWDIVSQTLVGVGQMITGRRGAEDLGGPLRIAQLSGQIAAVGIVSLLKFIATLSVSIGLINLFPIPVLDGGHLMFFLAEAIRGRPLPARAVEYGFRAGLALIVGLFVFVTWNDLGRIGLFSWVANLMG